MPYNDLMMNPLFQTGLGILGQSGPSQQTLGQRLSGGALTGLQNTLSMRQADRQRLKDEMQVKAAQRKQAQDAALGTAVEQMAFQTDQPLTPGQLAATQGVGDLSGASAYEMYQAATPKAAKAPEYGIKEVKEGDKLVTYITENGIPTVKFAEGIRGKGQTINVGANVPAKAWETATGIYDQTQQDAGSLGRLTQMSKIVEEQGEAVLGLEGGVKRALAPIATMVGLDTTAMGDAQILKTLFSSEAGSKRLEVVGPGPVSEYEQKLLQDASGGKISSGEALKKLFKYNWEKITKKINKSNTRLRGLYNYEGFQNVYPQFEIPEQPAFLTTDSTQNIDSLLEKYK